MDGWKTYTLRWPPSPQFWGDMNGQSPPELGDLGGQRRVYRYCPNCSQKLQIPRWSGFRTLLPLRSIAIGHLVLSMPRGDLLGINSFKSRRNPNAND
jgi:hypothetical protein